MASLNKVLLIGGLVRDPETVYSQSGTATTKITVGTTEKWKDKNTGEQKERSEYSRVTFFGKQAETIGKYMVKGSQIYVEGRLQTSQYEKDGITRYSTDIIASNFQFIGKKADGQQQPNNFQQNERPGFNNFQQPNNQQSGFQKDPPF
jgi:single-strand DNA-binding protein